MEKIQRNRNNYTLLVDFYELTMAGGFLKSGRAEQIVTFDMFFRTVPDHANFAIMAGLEQVIDYIENLNFTEEDIDFLKSKGIFDEAFFDYLRRFHFECDMWAVPEGTVIFPGEPLVIVKGPALQAQFIETMLLVTLNHQSMIATKANRIVTAADGRPVIEFGSRRAQGYSGAILGARAAYIGGCIGTACTLADKLYGVPSMGTMAHSWVQLFDTEYEAFLEFAKAYPDNCVLLVDTYDTLGSGVPNAIKVFTEYLVPNGYRPKGIRIDSGDMAYLSKMARYMLDEAGFTDCTIMASNSLDEYTIDNLKLQKAAIDSYGVGERLITSKSAPVFGGVYKLTSVFDGEKEIPKIKISENVAKITNPGFKKLYRFYDKATGKALADVVTLAHETIDTDTYEIFHPIHIWKRKVLKNFEAVALLEPVYEQGQLVYDMPSLDAIRDRARDQVERLWDEVKRLESPQEYIVDLSQALWDLKDQLLKAHRKGIS
ncbi:nicotinate phosphoribosyltransferase [Peptoniphilus equinus]|uniref:Nicotinate phosphoribosyltransferase n=1 Tax=Peptoniphilus equinus TaxID=3016343 RepID=A0ABY7QW14_9FIRM|nr:nicotinate phosphoribosyltransferase [Peptoniphilus equinus]WBW50279.1 nicotinate phosphoribosyltransferase [Peptoniphilus equinus]